MVVSCFYFIVSPTPYPQGNPTNRPDSSCQIRDHAVYSWMVPRELQSTSSPWTDYYIAVKTTEDLSACEGRFHNKVCDNIFYQFYSRPLNAFAISLNQTKVSLLCEYKCDISCSNVSNYFFHSYKSRILSW